MSAGAVATPGVAVVDRLRALAGSGALARPFVLLEDGRGGGDTHLAWGACARRRVEWNAPDRSLLSPPHERLWYGVLGYDAGTPAGLVRRAPAIPQPLVDLFEPLNRIVMSGVTGAVACDGPDAAALLSGAAESPVSSSLRPDNRHPIPWRSFDGPAFEAAVRRAREYIAAGDIYQVNLSVAERWPLATDPWDAYLHLRRLNPSPWMGYADFGDWQLVCGSPELLVEWTADGRLRTRPIAGTRKKTGDAAADARMRAELTLDEKERAEHLMLVDLARNDIGRLAQYGSVRVAEREAVEEYSHVFHLVSEVEGRAREGITGADVVAALFPGGTITGCPKIRAMEIIAELEPVARGAYTGALGWIGRDALQLNIVIRSAVVSAGQVAIQAGAGIVADSIPRREWNEALRKATAIRSAFGYPSP